MSSHRQTNVLSLPSVFSLAITHYFQAPVCLCVSDMLQLFSFECTSFDIQGAREHCCSACYCHFCVPSSSQYSVRRRPIFSLYFCLLAVPPFARYGSEHTQFFWRWACLKASSENVMHKEKTLAGLNGLPERALSGLRRALWRTATTPARRSRRTAHRSALWLTAHLSRQPSGGRLTAASAALPASFIFQKHPGKPWIAPRRGSSEQG